MNPLKVNGTYDVRAFLVVEGKRHEIGELESNWVECIYSALQHHKQNGNFPDRQITLSIVGKKYDLSESYQSEHKISLNSTKRYIRSLLS